MPPMTLIERNMSLLHKITPGFIKDIYRRYKSNNANKAIQGNAVYCPLCQSKFAYFAPFGSPERQNARCHKCGSLERHRLLWKYLNEKTNLFSTQEKVKVLHFAPERALYNLLTEYNHIEYVPCDLSPDRYKHGGKVAIVKADITDIPFEADTFDVVLCNHVLEHIPDDRKAMSEMYRVMKKGAWGIFQVPIDYSRKETYEDFSITSPEERIKAFGQYDHVRWYGQDYKDRLASVGFLVNEDPYVKGFSEADLKKFGFMPTDLIYNCSK